MLHLCCTKTRRESRRYFEKFYSGNYVYKRTSFQDKTYTLETCFFGCRQRDTISKCGCANPRFHKRSTDAWCKPTKDKCEFVKFDFICTSQKLNFPLRISNLFSACANFCDYQHPLRCTNFSSHNHKKNYSELSTVASWRPDIHHCQEHLPSHRVLMRPSLSRNCVHHHGQYR